MLFHVSEHGGIEGFQLRRADESSEPRVWAIDDDRLRNYLVPRDCPRVTYYAGANTSPSDVERFLGASHAVIAFEHAWLARVRSTRLFCYQLPPEGFELADACAGYCEPPFGQAAVRSRRRRWLERARQPRRRGPRAAESMGFARRGRQVDARVLDDPHAKCHAAFGLTISAASTTNPWRRRAAVPGSDYLPLCAPGKAPKGNRCVRERAYGEAAEEGGEEAMTTDQSACPICRRGTPTDVVAELDSSWVTMSASAPLRGYACLVFRRHAVELHDLSHSEGVAFMSDIRRLSGAVKGVTGAAKMNYEVHGNTIQHLHMHFYPRYPNDVFHGGPINPKAVTAPVYAAGEIEDFQTRLRQALGL